MKSNMFCGMGMILLCAIAIHAATGTDDQVPNGSVVRMNFFLAMFLFHTQFRFGILDSIGCCSGRDKETHQVCKFWL